MTTRFSISMQAVAAALLVLLTGCDKHVESNVQPLPMDRVPGDLARVFAGAVTETKELSSRLVTEVQNKDYAGAARDAVTLAGQPGLTKEQREITARSRLSINQELQNAAEHGDAAATQVMEDYRRNK